MSPNRSQCLYFCLVFFIVLVLAFSSSSSSTAALQCSEDAEVKSQLVYQSPIELSWTDKKGKLLDKSFYQFTYSGFYKTKEWFLLGKNSESCFSQVTWSPWPSWQPWPPWLQVACVRKLEVIGPDAHTLPRPSLWIMNHESVAYIGIELLGQLKGFPATIKD